MTATKLPSWTRDSVKRSEQIRQIYGDTRLSESITCLSTPGHTPGHQSVLVESGSKSAVFLGDLAIFSLSMVQTEWGPDWAWSRNEDILSRNRIAQYAADNGSILIVGHDPDNTFVSLRPTQKGYRVEPAVVE